MKPKLLLLKSLLQNQNNLSNMEQTFSYNNVNCNHLIKTISDCFSERKRSKEQINENSESNISSNNDVILKLNQQ